MNNMLCQAVLKIVSVAEDAIYTLSGMRIKLTMQHDAIKINDYNEMVGMRLQQVICDYYGITFKDLVSHNRSRKLVDARTLYAYIATNFLKAKQSMLAGELNKDHSTIIHYLKRAETLLSVDDVLAKDLSIIEKNFYENQNKIEA